MGCISITYRKINSAAKQAYLLSARGWMILSAFLNRGDSLTKALPTDPSIYLQFLPMSDHMLNESALVDPEIPLKLFLIFLTCQHKLVLLSSLRLEAQRGTAWSSLSHKIYIISMASIPHLYASREVHAGRTSPHAPH